MDSPHSKSLKSALESSFSNLRGSKWPNPTKLYIIYHLKIKKKLYKKVGKFWKKWVWAVQSIGSLRSDFHWSGRLEMGWRTPWTGSLATGFTPSLVTAQQTQKNGQKNSFTRFTILYIVDSPHLKWQNRLWSAWLWAYLTLVPDVRSRSLKKGNWSELNFQNF